MRLRNAGLHLLGAVVGILGIDALGHDAAGGHDLHQVGAGMDLLAHRLHHLVDTVGHAAGAIAVTAGHADQAAGAAHRRTKEAPGVVGVADRELDIVLAAAVPHRGDATFQRLAHELHAAHGQLGGAQAILHGAGIALGARQRVDVAVDDTGNQRGARRVDDLAGKALELARRGDALDATALFQHRLPVLHLLAVEKTTADIQRGHSPTPESERGATLTYVEGRPQPSGSASAPLSPPKTFKRSISSSMPGMCGFHLRASSKAAMARAFSPISARIMPRPE